MTGDWRDLDSSRRLIGEHFRADGRPKRAWPTEAAAERGLTVGQHVYACSFCRRWHRASNRSSAL